MTKCTTPLRLLEGGAIADLIPSKSQQLLAMRKSRWSALGLATMLAIRPAPLSAEQYIPRAGEEWEITTSYETSEETSDESSSSSSGRDSILERLISDGADGQELEYDLPKGASAEDRAREWKLPARVLRSPNGDFKLLNSAKLEARLETWLKAAQWDRTVCGRWIFTWNAFFIDCDPQSVLKIVRSYDLRLYEFREGASISVPGALEGGTLSRAKAGDATLSATLEVDPEAVRRGQAESDVVVGEILKKPVALADALRERSKDGIRGSIRITLESDSSGNVIRRVKVTRTTITKPNGLTETRTATETTERRRLSPR